MKIGFFSPYFDSMSGGERYLLTLASHWSRGHTVSLFCDDPAIGKTAGARLHIDLSRVKTAENVFVKGNVFRKLRVTREYDVIFFLTDGSIPTTFARKNILHFQVPFKKVPYHPIKMLRFQAIVCNSEFTKRNLDPRVSKRSIVIYPPVEPVTRRPVTKKNVLLSVGRFHPVKKQEMLIDAFIRGIKEKILKGFELVLAGGLLESDTDYFKLLKKKAGGYPVRLAANIPFEELTALYKEAMIYWHAAGFGETKPELMEHFGITTVEAMSAGCIPVVFDAGGQKEIVRHGTDGYMWETKESLLAGTQKIIADKKLRQKLSEAATLRAMDFSTQIFIKSFDDLLKKITS